MKKTIISALILIGLSGFSFVPVQAAAPTCHTTSGANYCQFTGKISRAYINYANAILIYFDTPITDVGVASSVGYSISNPGRYAGRFDMTEANQLFGKSLYATALTALAGDKTVTMQMRGISGGYLKIDRIWINQ